MEPTQDTPSNLKLARCLADVADALAGLDLLPPLAYVMVNKAGEVSAAPTATLGGVKDLVRWAVALSLPVTLEAAGDGTVVEVKTVAPLRSRTMRIRDIVTVGQAYDWAARLSVDLIPDIPVGVSAEDLLAVLDGERVATA